MLKIWDPFIDSQQIQPLLAAYQQKHPGVQIQFTKTNTATYQQDLLNALASGSGPDIFSINNAWLPQYVDKATSAPANVFTFTNFKNAFVDLVVNDLRQYKKFTGWLCMWTA